MNGGAEQQQTKRFPRVDCALIAALCVLAVAIALYGLSQFPPAFYKSRYGDMWFHADHAWVADRMTRIDADHARTSTHPIFSILTYPPAKALVLVGLAPVDAAKALVPLAGMIAVSALFIGLRGLALPSFVAALFSLVYLSGGAYVFWYSIVDTFAIAGATICFAFAVAAWPVQRPLWLWVLASASTLAVTVTNWSFALAAGFFHLLFRRFVIVSAIALASVLALSFVQIAVFKSSRLFFLPGNVIEETTHTQVAREGEGLQRWTPLTNARVLLLYSAVTPAPERVQLADFNKVENKLYPNRPIISSQPTPLAAIPVDGLIALGAWIFLLGCGVWGALTSKAHRPMALTLGAFLAGQIVLHLIYGEITFLYVAHVWPALVALAAFSYFTRARSAVIAAAALFVICGSIANMNAFNEASALARHIVATCTTTADCPLPTP